MVSPVPPLHSALQTILEKYGGCLCWCFGSQNKQCKGRSTSVPVWKDNLIRDKVVLGEPRTS